MIISTTYRTAITDTYIYEVNKMKPLTKEEEVILVRKAQAGDKKAEEKLFKSLAMMVISLVKEFAGNFSLNKDLFADLINEGNIGLLKAIEKFDVTKGFRLSTYARGWVKAQVNDFLDNAGLVKTNTEHIATRIRRIRERYLMEHGYEISKEELIDILKEQGLEVTKNTVTEQPVIKSIDQVVGDDDDCYGDSDEFSGVSATYNEGEKKMENEDMMTTINSLLGRLTERERMFVKMKFGIGYDYPIEYDGIADRYNKTQDNSHKITSERVRQIVTAAIAKMRK